MKKQFVLLFLLLSTQLYGCSNHISEVQETVPSVSEVYSQEPETLLIKENDTKKTETFDKEFYDDNSAISIEQKENSTSVQNIENMGTSAQDITLQLEETAVSVNDSCYSAATDIPRAEVENYAVHIKQQFLDHDWSAIASEISYPITISDITYNDSAEFLDASNSFENSLEEAFFSALEEEDCTEMFCSWQGIMLGETGQVWISEVLDAEFHSQGLRIIAINGMLK